ncbi:AAA family ATPase [Sediminibacillus albus]|uniref:AAA domain-containing protein n=1 Tax=Sediminibacillus albus TaxID=407036 RepID=A0A1G9AHI5_9BACI|nr:AAA family ATPase [Sediminibacillus albus]SDK26816.1 AAA domain-containing protein [Sediminibacillus albus]
MRKGRTVFLVSGPAGVGKSTTSKELAKTLNFSAYISGDYVSHMHIGGRQKPWENKDETSLKWENILSLTRNFINYGNDVVIDSVTFPLEATWLQEKLKEFGVTVKYVVLWTDKKTLVNRDNMRKEEHRMGERCLTLVDEFSNSELDKKHLLDTSQKTTNDMTYIINEIINNKRYNLNC